MTKQERDLAESNILYRKCLEAVTETLEALNLNYVIRDTRFNKTMVDILDLDDNKIGVGGLEDREPYISFFKSISILPNVNEVRLRELFVVEQEIEKEYKKNT